MLRNKFKNHYQDTLLESRIPNYPDGQLGSRSKNLSRSVECFLSTIAALRSSPRIPVLT